MESQKESQKIIKKSYKIAAPTTILTAIFVYSKVFQVGICSDWSWLWVLSPLWLPITLVIGGVIAFLLAVTLIKAMVLLVLDAFQATTEGNPLKLILLLLAVLLIIKFA